MEESILIVSNGKKTQQEEIAELALAIKAASGLVSGDVSVDLVKGSPDSEPNWAILLDGKLMCLCGKRSAPDSQDIAFLLAKALCAVSTPKKSH